MTGWVLESDGDDRVVMRIAPGGAKTVGRGARADFVLDAALVSRVHCRLTADHSGQLVLEDLSSTNGTSVNGEPVTRAVVKNGDTVTIGRVTFKVSAAQ